MAMAFRPSLKGLRSCRQVCEAGALGGDHSIQAAAGAPRTQRNLMETRGTSRSSPSSSSQATTTSKWLRLAGMSILATVLTSSLMGLPRRSLCLGKMLLYSRLCPHEMLYASRLRFCARPHTVATACHAVIWLYCQVHRCARISLRPVMKKCACFKPHTYEHYARQPAVKAAWKRGRALNQSRTCCTVRSPSKIQRSHRLHSMSLKVKLCSTSSKGSAFPFMPCCS